MTRTTSFLRTTRLLPGRQQSQCFQLQQRGQSCSRQLAPGRQSAYDAHRWHILRKYVTQAVEQAGRAEEKGDVPGFSVVRIPGNGSCMFLALAQGQALLTTGKLLNGQELLRAGFGVRRGVCLMLEKYREEVEPFISGDFDAYVSYMASNDVWGGEPELAMATRHLQRPILVYRLARSGLLGSQLSKTSEYGADEHPGVPPICLLFSGSHYDLLRVVS